VVLKLGHCYFLNPVVAPDRADWTPRVIESECAARP
jgi:hypothetical protein